MKLPKIAIQNSQFVLIIIFIMIILGVESFRNMPRAEDPKMNIPIFNIIVAFPGTSPINMEQLVINPIEEVINEIDDIKRINSSMGDGIASMTIQAANNIDLTDKFNEILREVNEIKATLPEGITFFEISKFNPLEQSVIHQYALVTKSNFYDQLVANGERLVNDLKKIKGLRKVEMEAYPEKEVKVSLDLQKMSKLGISFERVANILSTNNLNLPGGEIKSRDRVFSVLTTGGYESLEEIQKTILFASGKKVIRLEDIASVKIDNADNRWIARYNKDHAIWINIKMKEGANILQIAEKIKQVETNFIKDLPTNIKLETAFEQANSVKTKIDDFTINLAQGMALVGLIILLFLGWRSAIIISAVIPLCFLIGLAILNQLGFALQTVSIVGLILALGLIVDNGIVTIESIDAALQEGLDVKEAAIQGTQRVGYAIISSTLTTILAFFPLTQIGGGGGEFIKSLPLTVTITLLVSLILALFLSPILASKIMHAKSHKEKSIKENILEKINSKIYKPILKFSIRFGWVTAGLALGLLIFSLNLFPKIGVSLLPSADKPLALIDIEAPEGTHIEGVNKAVRFVEEILDTIPYVKNYSANIGHDNPQIFFNRYSNYKSNKGQILVNFNEWDAQDFYQTLNTLRNTFVNCPLAKITISELKYSTGTPPIDFIINGENIDTLKKIAFQVEEVIKATPGIINIKNPLRMNKTGLEIKLDKEKAGLLNLAHSSFDQIIRMALSGLPIGDLTLESREKHQIILRLPFINNPEISDLNKIYFNNVRGTSIPLRQVADVKFKSIPSKISHRDLKRQSYVRADVSNTEETIILTKKVYKHIKNIPLPDGYDIKIAGEYAEQQTLFGNLGIIFILILIGIFAILVFQFQSMVQPLVILSAIPFAVSGSFITLYLTGWSFSLFALIGFISLSGIVVNDSILIVDQINQLRAQGMAKLDAILLGSQRRLVPVILTTLTTILGLIPLAITQSNMWSPICATIIGGMLSSTIMILLIVPVFYNWFTKNES